MLNGILSNFYERNICKLIEEINLFKNEDNLWRTQGTVKNSSGNLALHITGDLNYFIGNILAKTDYVRNRDEEFTRKNVQRRELVLQLKELVILVNNTITKLSSEQLEADYPIFFDKPKTSTSYVLMQLLLHLNYHLGQVNYLRRILE